MSCEIFSCKEEALSLKLYAVHINHMLRGEEAKRDEEFVQDFCHKWNLSLNVEYRNIKEESRQKKCSEEEAGRIARYECFEKYAKEYHCGKIAVAHHQNDAAETILFRMLRGLDRREWRAFCRSMERLSVHFSV